MWRDNKSSPDACGYSALPYDLTTYTRDVNWILLRAGTGTTCLDEERCRTPVAESSPKQGVVFSLVMWTRIDRRPEHRQWQLVRSTANRQSGFIRWLQLTELFTPEDLVTWVAGDSYITDLDVSSPLEYVTGGPRSYNRFSGLQCIPVFIKLIQTWFPQGKLYHSSPGNCAQRWSYGMAISVAERAHLIPPYYGYGFVIAFPLLYSSVNHLKLREQIT